MWMMLTDFLGLWLSQMVGTYTDVLKVHKHEFKFDLRINLKISKGLHLHSTCAQRSK